MTDIDQQRWRSSVSGQAPGAFSLRGAIPPKDGQDSGAMRRGGGFALFPEVWTEDDLEIALDGYMVRDGRIVRDTPESRLAIARALRGDLGAFLRGIENGVFNLVAHDRRQQRTIVASDERGVLPLYLHEDKGLRHFASDLRALFSMLDRRPALDPVGAAEIYLFGYPIGNRTSYTGVTYPNPGTIAVFDWRDGSRTDTRWTHPKASGKSVRGRKLDDLLDEICSTVDRAVNAFDLGNVPGAPQLGIKLSGGMDSRLIGAAWKGAPLHAYTFGESTSAEIRIAKRLAQALGFPQRTVNVDGDLFADFYSEQMDRFAMAEWFHACLVPPMVEDNVGATFDGLGGDVLIGGLTLKRKTSRLRTIADALGLGMKATEAPTDDEAIARFVYSQIRLPDADFAILTDDARHEIEALRPAIMDDLAIQVSTFRPETDTFESLYTRIMLNNRTRRHVAMQGAVCRPAVETFYPFLDTAIGRLASQVPVEMAAGKRLYIELFSKRYPAIRHVPGVMSLLPFTVPARAHYVGRLVRFGLDNLVKRTVRDGSRMATNSVQWEVWFRRNAELRDGLRKFVAGSRVVDCRALEALAARIASGDHVARGTRIMYTASYAALFCSAQ